MYLRKHPFFYNFGHPFSHRKRIALYYRQNDVTNFICCGDLVR